MGLIRTKTGEYPVNICGLTADGTLSIGMKDMSIIEAFSFASESENFTSITYVTDREDTARIYEGYTAVKGVYQSPILGTMINLRREI